MFHTIMHLSVRCAQWADRRLCWYLPYPLKLWWCRLWIRSDEFHPSLHSDANYYPTLPAVQQKKYWDDLLRRRDFAHRRTL